MILWRIVKERHAKSAFDGEGAAIASGRWNPKGVRMVYASESVALAMLESLANIQEMTVLMTKRVVIRAELDDSLIMGLSDARQRWDDSDDLTEPEIGRRWTQEAQSLALRVPSAIVPTEYNYLINPLHPKFAELRVGPPEPIPFDPRLKQLGGD